jgi:hypothetical protein
MFKQFCRSIGICRKVASIQNAPKFELKIKVIKYLLSNLCILIVFEIFPDWG